MTCRCLKYGAAAALAVLVSACATQQGQVESATPQPSIQTAAGGGLLPGAGTAGLPSVVQPPSLANYPKTIEDSNPGPAVLSLYRQAQAERAAGHADQADAALGRALHIEPRNPFVWQALAGVKLDLKDPDQAENAAQRSTSLAHGNPYVEAGNWRLIASARQARGDSSGAVQAQARADGIARSLSGP